jgi:hypothetical protein
MTQAEKAALEYLADPFNPFCSPFEIATVVQLWEGTPSDAVAFMERWETDGWVEVVEPSEPDGVPFLTLTAAGEAALASIRSAS